MQRGMIGVIGMRSNRCVRLHRPKIEMMRKINRNRDKWNKYIEIKNIL